MRILIAEDDDPKYQRLREFVVQEFPDAKVDMSRSVTTALASLRSGLPDLLLLDMSLPTYEIAPGEQGGRPQDFGGITVMDFMDFEDLEAPVVIVTQYETFPVRNGENMSLEVLAEKAAADYPRVFKGLVYYSSVENTWQDPLKSLMTDILGGGAGNEDSLR